jgi:hypothetical protein
MPRDMWSKYDLDAAARAGCPYKDRPCPGGVCELCRQRARVILLASGALREPPWLWPLGAVIVLFAMLGFMWTVGLLR